MLNLSLLVITVFTGLFSQINITKAENDTVKGRFYIDPPLFYFIHVNYPLDQILFTRGDTTYIYYPKSKKSFKLINNYSNTPEVSKSLMPTFKDEYLTRLGMILVKSDYKNNSLIKYYSPTDSNSPLKFIKIIYKNHLISLIEVIDKKDKVIKRSIYGNYKKIDGKNIAMTIKNYSKTGNDSITSEIDYNSFRLIKKIPDNIRKFKIPEGIELKIVKW